MTGSRDTLIDLLRFIAIVMIVTVHTWSLAHISPSSHSIIATIYKVFYQCGVPLFVLLSGALQLSSPISSIGQYYKKRSIRILIPFFIWSGIVYIISCMTGKYPDIHSIADGVRNYIPYLLENRINEAYWFVGMIVVLYSITPFIQQGLERCGRRALITICLIWLVFVIVQKYYPEIYLLQYTSRLTYYLGFYILGYLFHREWRKIYQPKVHPIILSISNSSYMIYLMHMIMIRPIYMLLGFNGASAATWQCAIYPAATSIIVVGLCTIIAVFIKRIMPKHCYYLGIN